jgi:hypothetical protein
VAVVAVGSGANNNGAFTREGERESSCVHVCDVVERGGSRRWEEEPKQLLIVSK